MELYGEVWQMSRKSSLLPSPVFPSILETQLLAVGLAVQKCHRHAHVNSEYSGLSFRKCPFFSELRIIAYLIQGTTLCTKSWKKSLDCIFTVCCSLIIPAVLEFHSTTLFNGAVWESPYEIRQSCHNIFSVEHASSKERSNICTLGRAVCSRCG